MGRHVPDPPIIHNLLPHLFHVVDEEGGHAGGVEEEDGHDVHERVALDRPLFRPRVHRQVPDRRSEENFSIYRVSGSWCK